MTCRFPLKAFKIGITENGKDRLKICSFSTAYVIHNFEKIYDYKLIPCGRCVSCRLAYSRQWSIRCCLEASFYDSNIFLTLTYSDEFNPRTLLKEHLQLFIKRLRRKCELNNMPSPRFFACGEYGSEFLRPHFHLILFNFNPPDRKFLKHSKTGYDLFESDWVSSLWPYGFANFSDSNIRTAGYVARYCLKGVSHSDIESLGLNKEFIVMSRRPGIGFSYFDKNKIDIYKTDKVYFDFGDFNTCSPPKYYDDLMSKFDSDLVSKIKDKRRFKADLMFTFSYLKSDLVNELEYINMVNDVTERKINVMRLRKYA